MRGSDILRYVIVSGYVAFCQIKVFRQLIFIIYKMYSRAGFIPRAVVWRPLIWKNERKGLKYMTMSILLLWREGLVIVTYNVWRKTPECFVWLYEDSEVLPFSPGLSLVAFHG